MNPEIVRLFTEVRIAKLCLNHFGFKPSKMDITQKLAHINRIDNRAPCDIDLLREHIIKTMVIFIGHKYPSVKKEVIEAMIRNIKKNTKQLPLP